MKNYTISWNGHRLELGKRTLIMGIVNITPDSFSDGGMFFEKSSAVAQAEKMIEDGADILDIGGESTRPFSDEVSEEEECRRVLPVIEAIAKKINIPISIDTKKSGVAKRALNAGASIINDISALQSDPEMAKVAAEAKVPVILMHMKGTPKNMQVEPVYADLIGEIRDFFQSVVKNAVENGISQDKIIIDPGIGFGKTVEHNLRLIKNLNEFAFLDLPILIGTSRKAFIRKLLKQESNPMSSIVETGTQASIAAAVFAGVHIVRVHNVANTKAALTISDAIRQS